MSILKYLFIPGYTGFAIARAVYNALTDSSSSSNSSASSDIQVSHIAAEKGKRTRARKKMVKEVLSSNKYNKISEIQSILQDEMPSLGLIDPINITSSGITTTLTAANEAEVVLWRLCVGIGEGDQGVMTSENHNPRIDITLESLGIDHDEILKQANTQFGPVAGMDVNDVYCESDDPFIIHLMKLKNIYQLY